MFTSLCVAEVKKNMALLFTRMSECFSQYKELPRSVAFPAPLDQTCLSPTVALKIVISCFLFLTAPHDLRTWCNQGHKGTRCQM